MEKNSESQIRTQLTTRWPKLPENEVDDIVSHHDHLRSSLKKHYEMDERDAKKEEQNFFKSTASRQVPDARK